MSRLEDLRQVWRRRYSEMADALLEPFGLSEQQRIEDAAAQARIKQLRVEVIQEARAPVVKRSWRLRLYGWRMLMRGRMGR